jgi:hypothetical protein
MTTTSIFVDTLLRSLLTQIPVLIALPVAIVMIVINWATDRRKTVMGVIAFGLALVSALLWPPVVALSAWLVTTPGGGAIIGSLVNGGGDFVLNILTGLAWLLIVLALFGRKAMAPANMSVGEPHLR